MFYLQRLNSDLLQSICTLRGVMGVDDTVLVVSAACVQTVAL